MTCRDDQLGLPAQNVWDETGITSSIKGKRDADASTRVQKEGITSTWEAEQEGTITSPV